MVGFCVPRAPGGANLETEPSKAMPGKGAQQRSATRVCIPQGLLKELAGFTFRAAASQRRGRILRPPGAGGHKSRNRPFESQAWNSGAAAQRYACIPQVLLKELAALICHAAPFERRAVGFCVPRAPGGANLETDRPFENLGMAGLFLAARGLFLPAGC